jgi:hypothetical protein
MLLRRRARGRETHDLSDCLRRFSCRSRVRRRSSCEWVVAENKCASPFCEAEFEIRYGKGVDTLSELIDLGIARGLIEKSGNHLSFAGLEPRERT